MYKVEDGVIVRTDTGKELRTMHNIAEHMNWLDKSNNYIARKDKNGIEYVAFVGTFAKYYDLDELCELCNCLLKARINHTFCSKKFEKHMRIKEEKERQRPVPYTWDGRYIFEHTARKGFWLEDLLTGKSFYLHINEHISAIVGLLNDYTDEDRFVWYHSKVGNVIRDTVDDETYVLGASRDVGFIRDILNYYDKEKFGERDFPYKHLLM